VYIGAMIPYVQLNPPLSAEPAPQAYTMVGLDGPHARAVGDHFAVQQDMIFIRACCAHLVALLAGPDEVRDPALLRALWTSAVITYARCFGTGVRMPLTTADVLGLGLQGEVQEFHEHLLAMRNKHLAHSVNRYEQIAVGALLTRPESGARRLDGIAPWILTHVVPDVVAVHQLDEMCRLLIEKVLEPRGRSLLDAARAEADAIDIDDLYRRPPLRQYAPGPEEAGNRRP
jgi:hypothetical protein